jgi:hypothetical protein
MDRARTHEMDVNAAFDEQGCLQVVWSHHPLQYLPTRIEDLAQRFEQALLACEADARGRLGLEASAYPSRPLLQRAFAAAVAVETGPLAEAALARGLAGPGIAAAIHDARVEAVRAASRPDGGTRLASDATSASQPPKET